MSNNIVPQPPETNNQIEVIRAWLTETQRGIESLKAFESLLQWWHADLTGHNPAPYGRHTYIPIPDEQFMAIIQDMSEAGMLEWLDGCQADIDQLRQVLTGGEA